MQRRSQAHPLLSALSRLPFDVGWPYVLAGLAMLAAAILIPAENDLADLRSKRDHLARQEARLHTRLSHHEAFLEDVTLAEPALVTRLAAAQLNLVQADATARVVSRDGSASVLAWIDDAARQDALARERPPVPPRPPSRLSRLTDGAHRVWLLAGAVLCIFAGLMVGQGAVEIEVETEPEAEPSGAFELSLEQKPTSPHAVDRIDVTDPFVAAPTAVVTSVAIAAAAPVAVIQDDFVDEDGNDLELMDGANVEDHATSVDDDIGVEPSGGRFVEEDAPEISGPVVAGAEEEEVTADVEDAVAPGAADVEVEDGEEEIVYVDEDGNEIDAADVKDEDEEEEIVYVDEDGNEIDAADVEVEDGEEEIVYVDEDGNEIDAADVEDEDEEEEIVYVDEDGNEIDAADVEDEDEEEEIVYVDEDGNEIDAADVEDEDEEEEIIYVDEDGNEIDAADVADEDEEEEIIYVDEDGNEIDPEDLDDEDVEFVYVDEDGNEIEPDDEDRDAQSSS